jgi:hypothetical protein
MIGLQLRWALERAGEGEAGRTSQEGTSGREEDGKNDDDDDDDGDEEDNNNLNKMEERRVEGRKKMEMRGGMR